MIVRFDILKLALYIRVREVYPNSNHLKDKRMFPLPNNKIALERKWSIQEKNSVPRSHSYVKIHTLWTTRRIHRRKIRLASKDKKENGHTMHLLSSNAFSLSEQKEKQRELKKKKYKKFHGITVSNHNGLNLFLK